MSRATTAGIFAPGSEQTVRTPPAFIRWVQETFGRIYCDMAALDTNACAGDYYGPDHERLNRRDSLEAKWPKPRRGEWLYCNPPFKLAGQFAAKAVEEGQPTLLLVPASVGANWWRDYVHSHAAVYIVGRLWFVGHKDPFPKDLALVVYKGPHSPRWVYPRLTPAQRGKPQPLDV